MLEDSRLKGFGIQVTHPHMALERTYCANCGKEKGWVSMDAMDFIRVQEVIVVCDTCAESLNRKFGAIPLREAPIQEVNLTQE